MTNATTTATAAAETKYQAIKAARQNLELSRAGLVVARREQRLAVESGRRADSVAALAAERRLRAASAAYAGVATI